MPNPRPDFYAMLGVLRTATQEQIKRAYLKAVKRLHPDKNEAPGETELFLDVQQAYEMLGNPERRQNYDKTLPPEEEKKLPIVLRLQYSRPNLVQMNEAQLLYVMADFHPAANDKQIPTPNLNICLLLDMSTSMQGQKLDMVKAAAVQLLKRIRGNDIFSIVTFSDRAEAVLPATRHIDNSRTELKIKMLQTSGGTEILKGLEAALEEVRRYANPKQINHIIMLTDGRTYGDEPACLELAKQAAEMNIGISGLGIGNDWNDTFLDNLAATTGGTSMYISRPQDIQKLLTEKFDQLSNIYAEDIALEYAMPENVEMSYAFRVKPEISPLDLTSSTLHLGPIHRDAELSVMMEFRVRNAEKLEDLNVLDGVINLFSAASPELIPPIELRLGRPVAKSATVESPPAALMQTLSQISLYRMQEKARADLAAGNVSEATERLKKLATHLFAQGERELARTIMFEAEHIQNNRSFSEEGDKRIKYGTRALISIDAKKGG